MSFFQNMFGGNSAAAQQQQAQPGNIPQGAGAVDPNNTTLPAGTTQQQQQQQQTPVNNESASPLAGFEDLWKTVESKEAPQNNNLLALDPKQVMESAKKANFQSFVTPDLMEKINAGGTEAQVAMMQAMNSMAQGVFAQAIMATSKLTETALSKNNDRLMGELPNQFKKLSVQDNLRSQNEVFNNPAVAPIISALEQQLVTKYPNASQAEITKLAQNYIEGLGQVFSPKQQAEQTKQTQETDWNSFLS